MHILIVEGWREVGVDDEMEYEHMVPEVVAEELE